MKIIKEIESKSVLTKSNLPETDYCINPYVGCLHNCVYCYARFMKRFTNHAESWGDFLDIKTNAVKVLENELQKAKKGLVLLSSVTDPYQPIEKKIELTREILKKLLKHQFPVSILTKSALVLRDIDLFKEFDCIEVGITITTTDDKISADFELAATRASKRIAALKTLKESGIRTYVFLGPILPGFTNIENIFKAIAGSADKIMAEALNPRCGNWDKIVSLVETKYPEKAEQFKSNTYDRKYWVNIEEKVRGLCNFYNIPLQGFYVHGTSKK